MKTSSKPKQEVHCQRHAEPRQQPQRQQPQRQQPIARAAAVAAPATLPAPVVVLLPQSESSESTSSSTSSSCSSGMRGYGSDTSGTASTAVLESGRGKAANSMRRPRYSDTAFPDRSKRSSSTDTGTMPEPQDSSRSNFWMYSVVAIVLTTAVASAISMSLRAADAEADESHEYVHPKRATTVRSTQCSCSEKSGSNGVDHDDGSPLERRRLTAFDPKQATVTEGVNTMATGSPNKSATVDGKDKVTTEGSGNASAVERLGGKEDASLDHGAPQEHVGEATKAFLGRKALKIGPGRRKEDARTSPTSRTPTKNDAVTGAVPEVQTRPKLGQPVLATSSSSATSKSDAGTNDKSFTSGTSFLPLKPAANAKRAFVGLPLKQLANEYPERETQNAAAKGDVVGTSGHANVSNGTAPFSEAHSP